jgi:hypothetical protein
MSKRWKLVFFGYAVFAVFSFATVTAFTIKPAAAKAGEQNRPSLPNEQTHGDERFFIHYTLSADDAVDAADANGNSVPDYVEQVLEALNTTYQVEVVQLGWAPPPADLGEGGDTRFDVYLENLIPMGISGYADSDGGYLGDNPATPEVERHAAYSYLSLDNGFTEVLDDSGITETPLDLLRTTTAHEFNHAVQAGYDAFDPQSWLYEATASWMEDEVFGETNDPIYYIQDIFEAPDKCRVAESGRYGSWLFLRLMSERYGREAVRSIWEQSRQLDGFDAIDAALEPYGSSLQIESRDFAVASLLRAYKEGATYPTIVLEGSVEQGAFTPQSGVQSLGADTIQLLGSGVVTVDLSDNDAVMFMRAVGIRGDQADVIDASNGTLVIDLSAYQATYIIIHNDTRTNREDNCVYSDYGLEVTPAGQPPMAATAVWPATSFEAPSNIAKPDADQPGASAPYRPPEGQPYSSNEFADEAQELEVPFTPIMPVALPPGYSFDYAYTMAAADFGASAAYYVPGGGISANYDYIDDNGNWLSVAQSPSPYTTLQEWLSGIDYFNITQEPGHLQTISGVDVLVEDLSSDTKTRINVIFVLDGLFIVVEGDHVREDVFALARNLIDARSSQPAATVVFSNPPTSTPSAAVAIGGLTLDALVAFLGVGFVVCGIGACLVGLLIPIVVVFVRQKSQIREKAMSNEQ